jgi:hypothetical protein
MIVAALSPTGGHLVRDEANRSKITAVIRG